jgi:LysM repeat protein
MKQFTRLTLFLLLNLVVSACTTLTVLYLWDQLHTTDQGSLLPPLARILRPEPTSTATPTPQDTPTPAPTPTPAFNFHTVVSGETFDSIATEYNISVSELLAANGFSENQILGIGETLRVPIRVVEIESIVGAGDLESERVVIRSVVDNELSLAGWQLETQAGLAYAFPQVSIYTKGGAVNVYTRAGSNTVSELFWGLDQPVWKSGEMATLRDPAGEVRATYLIP